MHLEQVIRKWDNFRRALRREDRELFDVMVNKARMHSSASLFNVHLDPMESVFTWPFGSRQAQVLRR
jgi:hypothetical protein